MKPFTDKWKPYRDKFEHDRSAPIEQRKHRPLEQIAADLRAAYVDLALATDASRDASADSLFMEIVTERLRSELIDAAFVEATEAK